MSVSIDVIFQGPWKELRKILGEGATKLPKAVEDAADEWGERTADAIVQRILHRFPPPNSPVTIALKGRDVPLVDTGKLMSKIAWRRTKKGVVRVGFLNLSGKTKTATAVALGGATIKVTPKMRGYMAARGFPLKASTTQIVIPPRPVVDAVAQKEAQEIFDDTFGKLPVEAILGEL